MLFPPEFSPSHWTLCKELLTLNQRQSSSCQKTFCLLNPGRHGRDTTRIAMMVLKRLSAFSSKVNACLLLETSKKKCRSVLRVLCEQAAARNFSITSERCSESRDAAPSPHPPDWKSQGCELGNTTGAAFY